MVNFTFLIFELILADQLADLPPTVESSSGEEWQFYISTIGSSYWQDQLAGLHHQ